MMLLAGDIGGTKTTLALYALQKGPRFPIVTKTFSSKMFDSLETVIDTFLREHEFQISYAAFGVAGPVVGRSAHVTNLPWVLDEQRLADTFQLQAVHLINDLEAVATAVPILEGDDIYTLNPGAVDPTGAIGVIAPGTGLGEGFLVWGGQHYHAYPCEGGHTDFAPTNELQQALLTYLQGKLRHVSYERVCSGIGIPNLYAFLRDTGRFEEPQWLRQELANAMDQTPVIIRVAQEKKADICMMTLSLFIDILAHEAGNLALKLLATGGIYIGGGIPPRILPQLQESDFIQAFVSKGRFGELLSRIPVHVICKRDAGLMGVAQHGLSMMRQNGFGEAVPPVH